MQKYDIIIIGGGPGGYVAAIRAAQLGAKVALIEKDQVGGTCLNRGCIPTKAIIACTSLYEKIQKAESYGIKAGEVSIDFNKIIDRKNKIVEKLVKGVEFLLEKNKIEMIHGTATVLESGKIEVTKSDSSKLLVVSRKLILATGSSPTPLPGINFDGEIFLSSKQALELKEIPKAINIVGGGVIGIEFAGIFSSLGTSATIYEALPEILSGIDEEIVANLKRILRRKKINILTNTKFDSAKSSEKNLICVGRIPNLTGLEDLKLEREGTNIKVNNKMETSIPGVYAIGDLVSKKKLAHVASEQGVIAAENALGGNKAFSYEAIPVAIFTSPEIGSVGLTEDQAREKRQNVKIGKFPFAALGIAQAKGEIEGFIKVVADENSKILGVHILSADATNIIGAAAVAIRNNLTIDQLAKTVQSHPSYPEGLHEACLSGLKKALHTLN